MSITSSIEWTDATWNPIRGCTKISPGCKHCYASTFAERFRGVPGHPYEQGFDLRLVPGKLFDPFLWPWRKRIFVNSMSDLFHNDVPDSYILDVCAIMAACPWHTFQILTKRSSRLKSLLNGPLEAFAHLVHIWWGVSAEDRTFGPPRIKDLQATNVAMRFLSIEPLLEDLGEISLDGIAWLIAGGESGAGARPIKEEWVISLRDQCQKSKVPFFFKQWGGVQKKRHGRLLQGLTYSEMPELIQSAVPNRNFRMQLIDQFSLMAATSCSDGSFPKLAVTHAPLYLIEQVD